MFFKFWYNKNWNFNDSKSIWIKVIHSSRLFYWTGTKWKKESYFEGGWLLRGFGCPKLEDANFNSTDERTKELDVHKLLMWFTIRQAHYSSLMRRCVINTRKLSADLFPDARAKWKRWWVKEEKQSLMIRVGILIWRVD